MINIDNPLSSYECIVVNRNRLFPQRFIELNSEGCLLVLQIENRSHLQVYPKILRKHTSFTMVDNALLGVYSKEFISKKR